MDPMATVVLGYTGAEGRFEAAMNELRLKLPGAVITRKTHASAEAQLEDSQVAALQASSDWTVRPMVYADASPPGQNFARTRSKLQQR